MMEFRHPLPVLTPLGEGYAVYVTGGGAASAQRLAGRGPG